jgi:hypothetical protein
MVIEFRNIRLNPIFLLIYSALSKEIKEQAKFEQKEIHVTEFFTSKNVTFF